MHVSLLLALSSSWAGGSASTRVDGYLDPWIQVWAPSLSGSWSGERGEVQGGIVLDALSGATQVVTADGLSGATTFTERRVGGVLGGTLNLGDQGTGSLRWETSQESDYRSQVLAAGGSVELWERATVSLGYGFNVDGLGSSDDAQLSERSLGHQVDLGWTHILGPTTALRILGTGRTLSCDAGHGCLGSPYRYVALLDEQGEPTSAVPGRNPDRLASAAAGLRLSQAVGSSVGVHAGYRFYADTWSVQGHTAELKVMTGLLGQRLFVTARGRGSLQTGASFYADDYALSDDLLVPGWRTSDRELSGLRALQGGLELRWRLYAPGRLSQVDLFLGGDRGAWQYPDHSELPDRTAWMARGGIDVEL